MRHVLIAVFASLALASQAHAQREFEEFRRREAESLRAFLSKEDADFSDFLKQEWKEFELSVADKPLVRPKPRDTPVAPPKADAPAGNPDAPARPTRPANPAPDPAPSPAPDPEPVPMPEPTPVPVGPPPTASLIGGGVPSRSPVPTRPMPNAPVELASSPNAIRTPFYGGIVPVPKVELRLDPMPSPITGAAVGKFWEQMSASKSQEVLASLQRQRAQMRLGDWAFAQLAFRAGVGLTGGDSTLARLVAWHFLVKSGFASRVGFRGGDLFVLLRTDDVLYGVPYFTIDKAKFYVLDLASGSPIRAGSIHTYERDHPDAKSPLAFHMNTLPLLPEDAQSRTLAFTYKGKRHQIRADVNRNLIRFLTHYPQTQLNGYLDAEVPSSAMDALVDGLRPIIAGQPEVEQVQMILRFVQTAFEYKTDGDQFSREKWMFPEETLFYPYSDCEDRAILFSYLTRKLVPSVTVVGLIYSNHVATAVRFTSAVGGDARMYAGQRYVVADPTYIGADVGMEMPQYKDATPNVVAARPFGR